MPLPPPLLLVSYANTSRRFFSDKEAWSICHCPLPYCWSRTQDRSYVYLSTNGTRLWHTLPQVHRSPHPCKSGFTVRTGYMLEIPTLCIDIFLRLFSLCLRTGYRLFKIMVGILVRSPILSTLPDDKDLPFPNGWIRPYAPPHFRCISERTDSMLIKFVRTRARLPTLLAFVTHNRVNAGQNTSN